MSATLTEQESAWIDSLRDGHGPTGEVDPHSIRELVRIAQRMAVVTDEEQYRRDTAYDYSVADALTKLAAYYRTPRARRTTEMAKDLVPTVRFLVREFVNGWSP